MTGLTRKQDELLRYIEAFIVDEGFSPSFEEMRTAMGLQSKSGVARLVDALEERGKIRRPTNRRRAIEIVRSGAGPDVVIAVDRHGRVALTLSDRVTADWLRWHRAAVERALSERFAALAYPARAAE